MSYILLKPVDRTFSSMKKADKVARLHALFNNEADQAGLSPAAKDRIKIWVPDCLTNRYQMPTEPEGKDAGEGEEETKADIAA